jgi:hypothetical protein
MNLLSSVISQKSPNQSEMKYLVRSILQGRIFHIIPVISNYDFKRFRIIKITELINDKERSSKHTSQQIQTLVLLSLRPDLLANIFAINIIPTIATIPETDIEITQFSSMRRLVHIHRLINND